MATDPVVASESPVAAPVVAAVTPPQAEPSAPPSVDPPPAAPSEAPVETPVVEPTVEAAPVEPPAPELQKSLLGEAGKKPESPKTEEPAKVETETAPRVEPVKYEAFTLPEGVALPETELGKYTEILGKHNVPQEAAQALVDLYVAEQSKFQKDFLDAQRHAQVETWNNVRQDWQQKFKDDPEIGGNRYETTLKRSGALLEKFGSVFGAEREAALREVFDLTGAGDHPEMLRFMNWAANFAVERTRPVAATVPKSPQPTSRSQRRYAGTLSQGNGAA